MPKLLHLKMPKALHSSFPVTTFYPIVPKYPEFCGKIRTIANISISILENPKLSSFYWKI